MIVVIIIVSLVPRSAPAWISLGDGLIKAPFARLNLNKMLLREETLWAAIFSFSESTERRRLG